MSTLTQHALITGRLFCVLISLLFVVACSDDENVNRCEGVTCVKGACNPDTGQCGNPETCESADECLDGHSCELGSCFAEYPCDAATPCERGICIDGACTNSEICTSRDFCLPNFDCVEGVCEYDPCVDVVCDRGVCQADTGECVNSDVCTLGTERDDCLDDFYCYGQVCTPGEDVCDEIVCDRGVCDPSIQGCGNATSCRNDAECINGFFCDEMNNCHPNVCDEEFIICARGVCQIDTGECVNAEVCTSTNECSDGFTCIDSACVPTGEECGADGCEGNRVCNIDLDELTATCVENPNGCWRASDCDGGRVCVDGLCQSPLPCEADAFEPNDTLAEATDLFAVSIGNSVEAALCRDDVDIYTYDVNQDPEFQGTMVVDLQYLREDEGLGGLKLELVDPDGQLVDTVEGDDGRLRIEHTIGVLNRGAYEIRVSDVSAAYAGIRYGLYVDILPARLAGACLNPTVLTEGQTQVGNTLNGDSSALGSSCTSEDNASPENIWRFELTEPGYVSLRVTPTSGANLTMDLRTRCESLTSELTCVDAPNAGSALAYQGVLGPGDYFVVVQGEEPNNDGTYSISFDSAPIICGAADSACLDDNTSRYCRSERTGFSTETCALGCDPAAGVCTRAEGDICRTAIDANGGYSGTIAWGDFTGDYEFTSTGCVPDSSGTQTDGPDAVYAVTVPPQTILDVALTRLSGDYVSLYLTTDCEALPTSCIAGANAGAFDNESLTWRNDGPNAIDLFVVADIEEDSSYGSSTITISTEAIVCTALSATCVSSTTLEACNDRGTQLTQTQCGFGCMNDACLPPPNDTCATGIDLLQEPNNTFTVSIDEYAANEDPGSRGCTGRTAGGPDAVFTYAASAGEVITVDLNATFDAALWVATDCADAAGTCVAGSDRSGTGLEQVQFIAEANTTYTIFVDALSSSVSGTFTVSASSQLPSCTGGTVFGCNSSTTLSYCSPLGVPTEYTCASTCTGTGCDMPSGEVCIDPVVLTNGSAVAGGFDGPENIAPAGAAGSCNFSAGEVPVGAETIHAVDMLAGQVLTANFSASTSFAILYLLADCGDENSCLANTVDSTSGTLNYKATQDGRYFLIMDRTLTGSSSFYTYNLDVSIRTPDCQPGFTQPFCRADGTTLAYCDSLGFTQDYPCDGNCLQGACEMPTGDVCVDAIELVAGTTVGNTFTNTSNALQLPPPRAGACFFDDSSSYYPDGEDTIYKIFLYQGEVVQARLDSDYSGAYLYLMEDCADPETCLTNNARPTSDISLAHAATKTGYHYIVVDSTSSTGSTLPYTLSIDVIAGAVCAPNTVVCQGNSAFLCDSFGTGYAGSYPCTTACVDGACEAEPARDTCGGGTPLTFGTWTYDSFANYADTSNLTSTSCVGRTTPGPDAFYTIDVPAGEILHVRVDSLGFEDPILYAVRDCNDVAKSCVVAALPDTNDVAEFYWRADLPERLNVVVDGTSSTHDEAFRIWIETVQPVCTPGQTTCGGDGQTLLRCNDLGLYDEWPCDGTCTGGSCDAPTGEVCYDAITLADGESYSGDWDDFDDYVNLSTSSCFLYASDTPDGPDAVFAVDLDAGERMTATLTTTSTAGVMYVLDGCSTNPSDDCALARPNEKVLEFVAKQSQTYYLVVDSDNSSESNSFRVDVEIEAGFACSPGSSVCANDTVELCSTDGLTVRGTTSCPDGCFNKISCAQPAPLNDTCATAEIITGSVSILGDYGDYNSTIDPGSACTGKTNPGPDAIYQVTVPANHVLSARVHAINAGDDPAVYILSDCTAPTTSCLAGASSETPDVETAYLSTTGETVYVVVDSDYAFDFDLFELQIELRPTECSTGQALCDGSILKTCNALNIYDSEDCYWGCTSGACNPTPNNTCVGAIDISAGGVFQAPIELYTNAYDPQPVGGTTADSCTFDNAPGPDMVYALTAQAGDYVRMKLDTTHEGSLWISTSCNDAADAATTCIGGSDYLSTGFAETMEFAVPATGTYFVFADTDSTSTTLTGLVSLTVEIQPAALCAPGSSTCLDADTVSFCTDAGTAFIEASCAGGCSNGVCGMPTADVCSDALDVSTSGTYVVAMNGLNDDYNLRSNACVGAVTPGNDAVVFADVAANDVLDVQVTGAIGSNPTIYMVSDCTRILDEVDQTNCFQSANNAGVEETLTYSPAQSERVYVVLDATSTSSDGGDWTVDVYNGPPQCSMSTPCAAGFTCVTGICRVPTGDTCSLAIPLVSGDSDTKDFAGTDDLNLGTGAVGGCTFGSLENQIGIDHVYAVDLLAGQQLTASFTSTSSYAIMYLTSDCEDANACISNTADGSSGMLTYTATQNETISIVMDRTLSGSTNAYGYTLNVSVQ